MHDSELRIRRVRGNLTETLLPPVVLVCFLFRQTISMYLVSRAPAGAAGPRSFSESRLPQIFRLSHCIPNSNDPVVTAVAAVDRYYYCYLLQQCSTVTPPQPNTFRWTFFSYLGSFFLRWHPSRVSVIPTARRQRTLVPHADGWRRDSDMK